ncbi:Hypothetical predicted protein, partial [Pelobates cultripes]
QRVVHRASADQGYQGMRGVHKNCEASRNDRCRVAASVVAYGSLLLVWSVGNPGGRKAVHKMLPSTDPSDISVSQTNSAQKHRVTIFSRCSQSSYQWLMDKLKSREFANMVS